MEPLTQPEMLAFDEALDSLFRRYGVPLPANKWSGRAPRFASVQAACEAAVAAEIANGQLYERLLGATQRADILAVWRNLQAASQQWHLPAFQRCGQRRVGRRIAVKALGDAEQDSGARRRVTGILLDNQRFVEA